MTEDPYSGWDSYDRNPYYNPAKCGLEIEAVTEADLSYESDMVVLWRKLDDGELYWSADAGYSCPSPFEDIHALGDLTPFRGSEERYANEVWRVQAITV